jgi:hypothetical protein
VVCGAGGYARAHAKVDLEDVFFFFFRAHGEECRSDDHSEKYQCKDKIVDHWGESPFWRLSPSSSNHVPGGGKETSHFRAAG